MSINLMNKRWMARLTPILFLLMAACQSLPSNLERTPKVSLVEIVPQEFTLWEQRYLVTVRIQNPNPVALPLNGLYMDLELNDKSIGSGVSNDKVTIEPYSDATLDINLTSTLFDIFRQLQSISEGKEEFKYNISGDISLSDFKFAIPFEYEDSINIKKASQI